MNFDNVKEWRIPVSGVIRDVLRVTRNNIVLWEKQTGPDYTEPFYVENITNENETLSIVKQRSGSPTLTIEYSTNKTTWNTLGTTSTTALTRTVAPGERLYLKCNTNQFYSNQISGTSKVGGNIMSLLYGSSFTGQETTFPSTSADNFKEIFVGDTLLIDASKLLLPATTLTHSCYKRMFSDCTSLTTAPALPAITLTGECYYDMFQRCRALLNPPALPATMLASYCYYGMFLGCTSLATAPDLPATTLATYCYDSMFNFCSSLTAAPILPATTLVTSCYENMFSDCTSLNEVTCYATSGFNADRSKYRWLHNVSSTGTFTKAAGVTWPTGENGIPSGWTVVEV